MKAYIPARTARRPAPSPSQQQSTQLSSRSGGAWLDWRAGATNTFMNAKSAPRCSRKPNLKFRLRLRGTRTPRRRAFSSANGPTDNPTANLRFSAPPQDARLVRRIPRRGERGCPGRRLYFARVGDGAHFLARADVRRGQAPCHGSLRLLHSRGPIWPCSIPGAHTWPP